MPRLHELQHEVALAVLYGQPDAARHIRNGGLSGTQRLGIYRNNTYLGLSDALRQLYPAVEKLVGAACFDYLCRDFIAHYPPASACLSAYGEQFASFLAGCAAVSELPYLADTARLEWLYHEAYYAASGTALNFSALAEIPAGVYAQLCLQLQPSARLLHSGYPLFSIWQQCQAGFSEDERIDLNEGGGCLLLFRPELDVEIYRLIAGELVFLSALNNGKTLGEATRLALVQDAAFDLEKVLQRWLSRSLLTGFSLISGGVL